MSSKAEHPSIIEMPYSEDRFNYQAVRNLLGLDGHKASELSRIEQQRLASLLHRTGHLSDEDVTFLEMETAPPSDLAQPIKEK
jgi:hypothetical protein